MKKILISQYEAFIVQPKEGITKLIKRFNILINELQVSGKTYNTKELNMKFLLTAAKYLEPMVNSLRERDQKRFHMSIFKRELSKQIKATWLTLILP